MAVIVDIDHEAGDLTEYNTTVTDSGDLSVTAAAALAGSDYGLSCVVNDANAMYAQLALASANTSGIYRARFYIDPNSITMGDAERFIFLYVYNGTPALTIVGHLYYTTALGYQLRFDTYNDSGGAHESNYFVISDAPHYVELALTSGAGTGSFVIYIDGSSVQTMSSLDNDTRCASFLRWRWGMIGGRDAGTSGTYYLDEVVVNDDGGAIGPVSAGTTNITVAEGTVTTSGDAVTISLSAATITVAEGTVTTSGDAVTFGITSIALSTPVAYRVFQRSGGTGNIAISGTYSGSPTAIEGSWNGGEYATIDASPADGVFSGTLFNQPQGQGTLTVRFTNDTGAAASVNYVGIGDVFIIAGQSNAVGMAASTSQNYSHATLKAGMFANDYNWKELDDPTDSPTNQVDTVSEDTPGGSYYIQLATLYLANMGIPCAFVPCAKIGSRITAWQPGADHQDRSTLYGSMVYRALQTGARVVLWWQGESDVVDAMSQATYNAYLDSLANAVQADLGIKLLACTLEDLSTWTGGYDEATINDAIREAWADNANVLQGPEFEDHAWVGGGVHYSTDDLAYVSEEWWYALIANLFGINTARGNVTTTGDAVTLTTYAPTLSVTVAEGSVSTTGDAVTLSIIAGLTVGEGTVSVTGDGLTLGVSHPLTVAEGAVSVTGDAVTLDFGLTVNLTVAEGAVTTSGDAVTLGVNYPLTVAEGSVTVTGDVITLGVLHGLTVTEGSVVTSGDAVTLNFTGIGETSVTVAEGNISTTGDTITLGVLHPLTVAEGTVTTTCDAVTVTYNGIGDVSLTVAEGNVSTGGDAVTLGILHPLTVAEGLIAVGGDPVTITLAALILHGARRVYQPNTRATHRAPARATLEVDDD